jgi:quinol monooxygenase YgiN
VIIVTATLSFETEAYRNAAVERTAQVQAATRAEEPGCHAYCFAADPAVPTNIQVYELWDDAQTLTAHFDHPNYAAMVDSLRRSGGFVGSDNRMYLANDRGPVYGDDGKFRSDAV